MKKERTIYQFLLAGLYTVAQICIGHTYSMIKKIDSILELRFLQIVLIFTHYISYNNY